MSPLSTHKVTVVTCVVAILFAFIHIKTCSSVANELRRTGARECAACVGTGSHWVAVMYPLPALIDVLTAEKRSAGGCVVRYVTPARRALTMISTTVIDAAGTCRTVSLVRLLAFINIFTLISISSKRRLTDTLVATFCVDAISYNAASYTVRTLITLIYVLALAVVHSEAVLAMAVKAALGIATNRALRTNRSIQTFVNVNTDVCVISVNFVSN